MQKENNEIDNVLKSEKEDGDLVKQEDSTKHIGVQQRTRTKVPYKKFIDMKVDVVKDL